jgi:hypothetical protein
MKYELYHKITYSKMFIIDADDFDEAREKALDIIENQSDYKDYDIEEDIYE